MGVTKRLRLRAKMVWEWRKWAPRIAAASRKALPGCTIYVFGSVVRGDFAGGSDIDIMVMAKKLPSRALEIAKIKMQIEDLAGLPAYHPFEIRIVEPEEGETYLRRAGKYVEKLA
jgi:predicted nucleotidyltransferase